MAGVVKYRLYLPTGDAHSLQSLSRNSIFTKCTLDHTSVPSKMSATDPLSNVGSENAAGRLRDAWQTAAEDNN